MSCLPLVEAADAEYEQRYGRGDGYGDRPPALVDGYAWINAPTAASSSLGSQGFTAAASPRTGSASRVASAANTAPVWLRANLATARSGSAAAPPRR